MDDPITWRHAVAFRLTQPVPDLRARRALAYDLLEEWGRERGLRPTGDGATREEWDFGRWEGWALEFSGEKRAPFGESRLQGFGARGNEVLRDREEDGTRFLATAPPCFPPTPPRVLLDSPRSGAVVIGPPGTIAGANHQRMSLGAIIGPPGTDPGEAKGAVVWGEEGALRQAFPGLAAVRDRQAAEARELAERIAARVLRERPGFVDDEDRSLADMIFEEVTRG